MFLHFHFAPITFLQVTFCGIVAGFSFFLRKNLLSDEFDFPFSRDAYAPARTAVFFKQHISKLFTFCMDVRPVFYSPHKQFCHIAVAIF